MDRGSLDDPAALAVADPGGMLKAVASLGAQLRTGFDLGRRADGVPTDVDGVVVCGMGGSGIAGDVVWALYGDGLGVPLCVVKGHVLPGFCSPRTLVVIVSYSGTTREALWAYGAAADRGCRVVTVASGGELAARAATDRAPRVAIPSDAPVPRAAVGYIGAATVGVLQAVGSIAGQEAVIEEAAVLMDRLAGEWGPDAPVGGNEAKQMASWLLGRIPVIWGSEGWGEVAARRWKTQLNEDAKLPAFAASFPELAHNEIEGFAPGGGERFAIVVLRHPDEHPDVAEQIPPALETVGRAGVKVREISARGADRAQSLFSSIMLGDFVAIYLAILRGVDPVDIPAIRGLKAHLAT